MQSTDLLQELREAADSKKLDFLTVEKAKALKGKRIQTIYFGYSGQDGIDDFIVGDIISEYDLAKKDTSMKGYSNRAEYWESYMSKERLKEIKSNLGLMTAEGRNTYINAHGFNDGAFTCSDADRFVQYRIVDNA